MGLPQINIVFKSLGATAIERNERGIVAIVIKEATAVTPTYLTSIADIPATISVDNKQHITNAFIGYQKAPLKVLVIQIADTDTDYTNAMAQLETLKWDYLCVPEIATTDVLAIATWIKSLRDTKNKKVKAILPNSASDHEGIINFTNTNIKTASKTYTTSEYTARIAGLIAGTPLTISATFAPLPEVISVDPIADIDAAIDAGKFVLFNDTEKIKVARAVNSLTTTTQDKSESFKKIKIVDILDMIYSDIYMTIADNYVGKYANSYDNKVLLIGAIQAYLDELELEGLLDKGKSKVEIDFDAQKAYLKSIGYTTTDGRTVDDMKEQEIKEANTRDKVFLKIRIYVLDAMEEFSINVGV